MVTDRRMLPAALAAWAVAAVGVGLPPPRLLTVAVVAALVGLLAAGTGRRGVALVLAAVAATAAVTSVRLLGVDAGPLDELAEDTAVVTVDLRLTTDPRPVETAYDPLVVVEGRVVEVVGRGGTTRTSTPVLVLAEPSWTDLPLGATVRTVARLGVPEESDVAAVVDARGTPVVLDDPAWWWRGAGTVRAAVTESVRPRAPDVAALVPALVHGDDRDLPADLEADFRTAGLTHLLAVSGTNLTLVVGSLLLVGRALRLRSRGLVVLGLLGTVGFVLLARPEPSVVRAAAMGLVAILGMASGGTRRGTRTLAWAVLLLVCVDPWLSRTPGFVLSVCATAGIIWLAPGWRDALARWMPLWCAEAVAVPLAAQVACTPVVAAISGQVSLVAVVANVLVAPAVGPATVLGLAGGLVGLLHPAAGHLVGLAAGAAAGWIVVVGHRAAGLPGASVAWSSGVLPVLVLAVCCLVLAGSMRRLVARPLPVLAAAVVLVVVLTRPVSLGWPPPGWVMVVCDVGQGDAMVLDAGPAPPVVVDTGPDPALVDGCLDRLGVEAVSLVVLTHPHADHVDGLPGVLDGREVGAVAVSDLAPDPYPPGEGPPVVRLSAGDTQQVGDLVWEVLGPPAGPVLTGDPDEQEGEAVNDASLVLDVTAGDVRLLLTGDVEPGGQAAVLRAHPDLRTDVLKVPHHGSANQDPRLLGDLGAEVAVIGVGADNDYGHPAEVTTEALAAAGTTVGRTDRDGDLAVAVQDGELVLLHR